LRSFKERNVRIFFGGVAISHAGTWAQLTTVILLVRSLGGEGLELGIITACQFLPLLLFGMQSMDRSRFHVLERAKKSARPIRDGLVEVWSDPVLRITIVSFGLVSTFSFNTTVQIPLLVTDRLGEEDALFGYLLSALSVGNVIGSLLVARLVVVSHRYMYASGVLLSVAMASFSFATSTIVAFILIVPVGIGLTSFLNSSNVIVQQRTRPEIRSRVLALLGVIFLGSTPIGGPITGVIGDLYGQYGRTLRRARRWRRIGPSSASAQADYGFVQPRRVRPVGTQLRERSSRSDHVGLRGCRAEVPTCQ